MTPRSLAALCELLDDFLDWLEESEPGCLDGATVREAGEATLRATRRLVVEGAR